MPEGEGDWPIEIEHPPFGGCFTVCWGFSINETCSEYLRRYDDCTATCHGFVYDNCAGLWGSLVHKFASFEIVFNFLQSFY